MKSNNLKRCNFYDTQRVDVQYRVFLEMPISISVSANSLGSFCRSGQSYQSSAAKMLKLSAKTDGPHD